MKFRPAAQVSPLECLSDWLLVVSIGHWRWNFLVP